ncbi:MULTISPECIES: hypothetical protein [unclassified Nocardioides]|uniref:hypothetical protein n=1 Tax=unclassified Nocardioides TaxID=2615069 RepID=UPI000A8EE1A4|nr:MULTISPECIES: hypothetical protein [unclassified Nocardioides]
MSEFDLHEDPLPEDEPADDGAPVSDDTGTVYGSEGEAELTPHDVEDDEDEE